MPLSPEIDYDSDEDTVECLQFVEKKLNIIRPMLEIDFSDLTNEELENLGIAKGSLRLIRSMVDELTKRPTPKLLEELPLLKSQLLQIYQYVNMDHEAGYHMVLNAILLSVAKIASGTQSKATIFPEMETFPENGIQFINPCSRYEIRLIGSLDHVIVQYKDEEENKERLLTPGGSEPRSVFQIADRFLLVVKSGGPTDNWLPMTIPEAVGQALALAKMTNRDEIRFCLSSGRVWLFLILKCDQGKWTYYRSVHEYLNLVPTRSWDLPIDDGQLQRIVQLVLEWLEPSITGLYDFRY